MERDMSEIAAGTKTRLEVLDKFTKEMIGMYEDVNSKKMQMR